MTEKILLKEDKYSGQYVAFKSKDDNVVIGFGSTPKQALDSAIQNGYKNPILLYVPERNSVHIY